MLREHDLIAEFACLERQVLVAWIDEGLIAPHSDSQGYLFDQVDRSRIALACDLHYRMGLEHASLPIILSLIDQLHEARRHLRALSRAVAGQPDAVLQDIASLFDAAEPSAAPKAGSGKPRGKTSKPT